MRNKIYIAIDFIKIELTYNIHRMYNKKLIRITVIKYEY